MFTKKASILLLFLSAVLINYGVAQVSSYGVIEQAPGDIIYSDNAAVHSPIRYDSLSGDIDHNRLQDPQWAFKIRSLTSRKHYDSETEAIKKIKTIEKFKGYVPSHNNTTDNRNASMVTPILGSNFEGNWMINGTPSDNAMAISNGGIIVTANNDGVAYYSTSGVLSGFFFWDAFFNDPLLSSTIFDPRVIYDFVQDRFILVVLHGSSAATSKVLVCFSKSNNPTTNGWWYYKLSGNPLNNNCWFDYPNIGVSNADLFISGNLFNSNSTFNQALVYQITKSYGYSGASTLTNQYWHTLSSSPFPAFSLVPVSSAMGSNFSPGIYLVSNKSSGDSKIRRWRISGSISSNPTMSVTTLNTVAYSVAGNAAQLGTTALLDNGDCRIQNAFILDGIIHYTFHTDIGQGWNGIAYHRHNTSSNVVQYYLLGQVGTSDLSYPSVVAYTNNITDKSVMIALLRSGSTLYPEVRVVNCDNNGAWSSMTLVKSGETYSNLLGTNTPRWGDYTAVARRHSGSTQGRIWVAGCYGANIPSQQTWNTWKTWIAEVYSNPGPVGIEDDHIADESIKVYPNPVFEMIHVEFQLDQPEEISIELYDAKGGLVRMFYRDTPKVGLNRISFNKVAAPNGLYTLLIKSRNNVIKSEKLVLAD